MTKQELNETINNHATNQQICKVAARDLVGLAKKFDGKDNVLAGKLNKIAKAYEEIAETHGEIVAHLKVRSEG